jgi:glycosyltransferase involved in cell wall biosynthesis
VVATDRLFTVGIPCFDGRSLLRSCIQSVLDQTFPRERVEILVADDGSTETETLEILRRFEKDLAGEPGYFRVLWSDTNSGGAARPRNRVLDEATGEYVFFVDSDDTIGPKALARIAAAVSDQPPEQPIDWIAVHEVAVNGRATVFRAKQPKLEVPRARALSTLTVHKVFRRAEIERQGLRFDEELPSGQDVAFSFPFILGASRFLMLGGYDFYRLTQHTDDPNQPAHLSQTADNPDALIAKNERILRVMLSALRAGSLPDDECREIAARERYLRAIV